MRRNRLTAALLVLVLCLPLTGCWDRTELEEIAFVLAIGVDKGKESVYSVTFAIALPDKLAGKDGGGGGGKPLMMTTVEAPTVAGAIAMADSYLSRQVSLRHTKALFMGEEMARISGMHTMDEFVRFRQARRTMYFLVTKGKAADFLKEMEPKVEKNPQRYIEQLIQNVRYTALIPAASQIQSFITTVNTAYAAPSAYYAAIKKEGEEDQGGGGAGAASGFKAGNLPRQGGPNVELLGAAAFKGEHMVGVLTGEEMRSLLLLQGEFKRALYSIPDPKQKELFVSMEVHQGRPLVVNVDLSGPRPRISAIVTLEGELLSVQSNRDYTEPELQGELEDAAIRTITDGLLKAIQKTQALGADVAGFGRHAVRKFPTVSDWESYKWDEKYPNAEVSVGVRFTLRRFGKQLSPPRGRD